MTTSIFERQIEQTRRPAASLAHTTSRTTSCQAVGSGSPSATTCSELVPLPALKATYKRRPCVIIVDKTRLAGNAIGRAQTGMRPSANLTDHLRNPIFVLDHRGHLVGAIRIPSSVSTAGHDWTEELVGSSASWHINGTGPKLCAHQPIHYIAPYLACATACLSV